MKCELCGADMVLRSGRYGSFYACSRYPECKFTKQKTKEIGVPCPKCGGQIVMKNGRNRAVFYSVRKLPEVRFFLVGYAPPRRNARSAAGCCSARRGKPLLVCHAEGCGYRARMSRRTHRPSGTAEGARREYADYPRIRSRTCRLRGGMGRRRDRELTLFCMR